MTDDLVKRLRDQAKFFMAYYTPMDEAADRIEEQDKRIEALEAALRLIISHPVDQSQQWEIGCKEMKKVAFKYLGGMND